MKDRWTIEEYREYLRTGKEPILGALRDSTSLRPESSTGGGRRDAPSPPSHRPRSENNENGERTEGERNLSGSKRKYRNEPIIVDGIRFDSKHEARVYQELMTRVRAGEIRAVCRQVGFDLPGGIRYFADFVVIANDLTVRVLDAKSEVTRKNRVYINKKKQMLAVWGLEIEEV